MSYPEVIGEWETVRMLQKGHSIARFGDGELKMMDGAGYVREDPNSAMAHELRRVLRRPPKTLLRGIPTMDRKGAKYSQWRRHEVRFSRYLRNAKGPFYSAFISRPDSAQWIRTREFAEAYIQVWRDKRVAIVSEPLNKARVLIRADVNIDCPRHGAYAHIDRFEEEIVAAAPDIAILSCGVTATCLAARLARRGIQAIDFGSGGKYLLECLRD